ncbi:hypothetical protein GIB67_038369 [Kingdonia uniflora]|uniref:Uncharacterized protein n=1 Tax=Kingdonia uniflora TaxID=39325 RepID=A0A7J7NPJ4_9MAGN|nr:hypothetical protein GIB67_038369 [Kingdonia uniflora]
MNLGAYLINLVTSLVILQTCLKEWRYNGQEDEIVWTTSNSARSIWTELTKLLGYNRTVGDWDSEIEWSAQNFQGKDGMVNFKKMAFNAFFYQVWMERNNRIFKKIETPHKVILFKLVDEIRVKAAYKDMELKDTPQAQVLAN